MAKLYITEFSKIGVANGNAGTRVGSADLAREPGADQPVVDFTAGEQTSEAFEAETVVVRLWSNADAHFKIGPDGDTSATTDNQPITARVAEWRSVRPGDVVSIIAAEE